MKKRGIVIEVKDDLAKGKKVSYSRFKIAFAWATRREREDLRVAHPGFADRASNGR